MRPRQPAYTPLPGQTEVRPPERWVMAVSRWEGEPQQQVPPARQKTPRLRSGERQKPAPLLPQKRRTAPREPFQIPPLRPPLRRWRTVPRELLQTLRARPPLQKYRTDPPGLRQVL